MISCIGEDIIEDAVDPELRINNPLQSLAVNETYQFEATYLNNVGQEEENATISWMSSNEAVVTIVENTGLATAIAEGSATITATITPDEGLPIVVENELQITNETVVTNMPRAGVIRTTSSYLLTGDFVLESNDDPQIDLRLRLEDSFRATTSLPGLYVYLTNNPNSINDALEIGPITTFSGAHSYNIEDADLNQYNYLLFWCKPFSVKVGVGEFNQ